MKLTKELVAFAADSNQLFEQFSDYWNHYRAVVEGKKVQYDESITFDEKNHRINASLVKEIVRRSGVNYATDGNVETWFNHPLVVHETFAVVNALIDAILPESIIDTIGMYTDIRIGGWGDSFQFTISPRDLWVVSKHGRGQRSTQVHKQFKGSVTIIPELRQLTVGVSLYRVLSGMDSLAEFTAKAIRSMETQMSIDAYTAFETALAAVDSTATTGLLVAGYTQAALVRLSEQVTAWNGGAKAIVMGTRSALLNVLPNDANYRYTLDDKYAVLGYMPTISGIDVVQLPQVVNTATPFGRTISDSYLWLISPGVDKILKLCLEGNTLSNTTQPFENANLSQTTTIMKSWGVGVATGAVGAVITL